MIRQLEPRDTDCIRSTLADAPLINLFLNHCIAAQGLRRDVWCGRWLGRDLVALAYLAPGRLFVPWSSSPEHAEPLGRWLKGRFTPCLMVGPRNVCDAIWSAWAGDEAPAVWYDQQLHVLRSVPSHETFDGFRLARDSDWRAIAAHSAAYAAEDLGEHAPDTDAHALENLVRERIRDGRTYVIEREKELLFHVHVGANTPDGCMVGGTYVPPKRRGHGYATQGMMQTAQALLQRWPAVTLHVNEANSSAVRVYEKAGFIRHAPYRLAMPHPNT